MSWLLDAKAVKDEAVKNRVRQLFLQPIFEGEPIRLTYHKFKLDSEPFSDKQLEIFRKSGVLADIRGKWGDWGSFRPLELHIHGVIVKMIRHIPGEPDKRVKRFIATSASNAKGKDFHNQLGSLNLLHCRGFITPLSFCSWMMTENLFKSSLMARLDHINKALALSTPLSWGPALGLKVYDCIGWRR